MTEDKLYTKDDYDTATALIGKTVWFFLKGHLPQGVDSQAWAVLPNISVMLGKTVITGVSADIKKVSTKDGTMDEYRKLVFILKNPYYIKEPEPEEGAMGFPSSTVHSWETWQFGYLTLNKWFFETKELAIESIKEFHSMYEIVK